LDSCIEVHLNCGVVTHLLSEFLLTHEGCVFCAASKAALVAFQAALKDAKGPWHPSVLHPWHPSVQSHREVIMLHILLCTEAQQHVLAVRLLFCLAR
jgi:hypothetical protein